MQRDIMASTSVRAPLELVRAVLRDEPVKVFSGRPATPEERRTRTFTMAVTAPIGSEAAMEHDVEVTVGRVRDDPDADSVSVAVTWRPCRHQVLLPDFAGSLRATVDGGHTRLELNGTYTVPLGPVGRFGDSLVGRRVARQSLAGVVDGLARRLDTEADRRTASISYRPAPYPIDLRERPLSR